MEESTLADCYTIIDKVGKGAYGTVKKALNKATLQEVALKIVKLPSSLTAANHLRAAFKTEADIQKQLSHDNIVKIFKRGIGTYQSKRGIQYHCIYIEMELCEGGELFNYLVASRGFPEPFIRSLMEQLLMAMEYMHGQGVVHRDLKPENLLLGEYGKVKLADFGFAAVMDESGIVRGLVGSTAYAAPEVLQKLPYIGPLADIYSLGVMLFTLRLYTNPFLTSEYTDSSYSLFRADDSAFWEQKIAKMQRMEPPGEEFKELVRSMLAEKPENRPSIAEIRAHRWMAGTKMNQEEFERDVERRTDRVKEMIRTKKEENKKKKRVTVLPSNQFRNITESGSSESDLSGSQGRPLATFHTTVFSYFRIFTPLTATQIAFHLRGKFEPRGMIEKNDKFRFELNFDEEETEKGTVRIDLKADEEGNCIIECSRLSGCFFSFAAFFEDLSQTFDSVTPSLD